MAQKKDDKKKKKSLKVSTSGDPTVSIRQS